MSELSLEEKVLSASREMDGRAPEMGTDYVKQGRAISGVIWVLIAAAVLMTLALLYYVSSYGPLGKGFAGLGLLWLSLRVVSAFRQNRGY